MLIFTPIFSLLKRSYRFILLTWLGLLSQLAFSAAVTDVSAIPTYQTLGSGQQIVSSIEFTITFDENITTPLTADPILLYSQLDSGLLTAQQSQAADGSDNQIVFTATIDSRHFDLDGNIELLFIGLNRGSGFGEESKNPAQTGANDTITASASGEDADLNLDHIPQIISLPIEHKSRTYSLKQSTSNATFSKPGEVVDFYFQWHNAPELSLQGTPVLTVTNGTNTYNLNGSLFDNNIKFSHTLQENDGGQWQWTTLDFSGGNVSALPAMLNDISALQHNLVIDDSNKDLINIILKDQVIMATEVIANKTGNVPAGEVVEFTVKFNEPVNVDEDPALKLRLSDDASNEYFAIYNSGSGTNEIKFIYTVNPGNQSINLFADTIYFSSYSATITGSISNTEINPIPLKAVTNFGSLEFSAAPQLNQITGPNVNSYIEGDTLYFTLQFDQATHISNTPQLLLEINGQIYAADYARGDGSTDIVFAMQIPAGLDAQNIELLSLSTASGHLMDGGDIQFDVVITEDNRPDLTGVTIDAAPKVISVSAPSPATYDKDEQLSFVVSFDENVTVTGSPKLVLTVGDQTRNAVYTSGSGTDQLQFDYQVAANDEDDNGITINHLRLINASIKNSLQNADLTLNNIDNTSAVLVDALAPAGYQISVTPSLITTDNHTNTSITLTNAEVGTTYEYSVRSHDDRTAVVTHNGIISAANQVISGIDVSGLDDGQLLYRLTLSDDSGNQGLTATASGTKNTQDLPVITEVVLPVDGKYATGQVFDGQPMDFVVKTNAPVTATGSEFLAIRTGINGSSLEKKAEITGHYDNSRELTFRYIPVDGETDADGIEVESIQLAGGNIIDQLGNALDLTLNNLPDSSNVQIKNEMYFWETVSITPSDDNLEQGDTLTVTLTMNEYHTVSIASGSPTLTLKLDSGNVISAIGTVSANQLNFVYTVQNGDSHTNGSSIEIISLNYSDGDVTGRFGNFLGPFNIEPFITDPVLTSSIGINTSAAVITSVTGNAGVYQSGDNITVTLTFDKNISLNDTNGSGTPQLTLKIGDQNVVVENPSINNNQLSFAYTVTGADQDVDGIDVLALDLNGDAIVDAANNIVDTSFTAHNLRNVTIDQQPPASPSFSIDHSTINSHHSQTVRLSLNGAEIGTTYEIYIRNFSDSSSTLIRSDTVNSTEQLVSGIDVSDLSDGIVSIGVRLLDGAGNASSYSSVTLNKETVKPVISLNGAAELTIAHASVYSDAGATASDNTDGDISADIQIGGLVDTSTVGSYQLEYNVSDAAGNQTTATRLVHVTDQTAPVMTAPTDRTVAAVDASGSPATQADIALFLTLATANDAVDGVITNISHNAPARLPLGDTLVTFEASDVAGNTGSASATLTLSDQTAPVINITGAASLAHNVGIPYTDAGATASDNVDGDISANINSTGSVDITQLGSYQIHYDISDAAGNAAVRQTRHIQVRDPFAPVVNAPAAITIAATNADGTLATNTDIANFLSGASANDNVDGTLTVSHNGLATFPLGTTTVTFSATDLSGNTGSAQSTITITDQTAPTLILTGSTSMTLEYQDTYNEPGASASDNVDGNLTDNIVISGSVDTQTLGIYNLSYDVSDAAGNAATTLVRQISVQDSEAPLLQIPTAITVAAINAQGTPATNGVIATFLAAASATDNHDNQLSVSNDAPAVLPLGITVVNFSVTDSSENTTSMNTTITVTDQTAPLLVLAGEARMTLSVGDSYQEPGFTASDNVDGDLTAMVTTSSNINTNVPGSYLISYQVSDVAGHSVSAERRVDVNDDDAPVFTGLVNTLLIEARGPNGTSANDSQLVDFINGISATDNVDDAISFSHDLTDGMLTLGNHQLSLQTSDAAGNQAQASVTLSVVDTTPPGILLLGANPTVIQPGDSYFEYGVVASDLVDGNLSAQVQMTGSVDNSNNGEYSIEYRVTDANGNQALAIRKVIVSGSIPPPAPDTGASDTGGHLHWWLLALITLLASYRRYQR